MSAPTFLVIGAQKCGTTWLERNLGVHPEVATPAAKELHFFDKAEAFSRGREWYEQQFPEGPGIRAAGEFTPNYFWLPGSEEEAAESGQLGDIPQRIRSLYPDLRLILILRDPVRRAISAYYHHIRARRISPRQSLSQVWHRYGIRSMGEYGRCLQAWLACFPVEQFRILFFEETVLNASLQNLQGVYGFIGVEDSFVPEGLESVYNPGDSHFLLRLHHRLPALARLLRRVNPGLGKGWERFHIPVTTEEREALRDFYDQDSRQLEILLDRKLPWK